MYRDIPIKSSEGKCLYKFKEKNSFLKFSAPLPLSRTTYASNQDSSVFYTDIKATSFEVYMVLDKGKDAGNLRKEFLCFNLHRDRQINS